MKLNKYERKYKMKRLIKKANIKLTEDNCFIKLKDVINDYGLDKLKKESNNQLEKAWQIINIYKKEVLKKCKEEHPSFARYIEFDCDNSDVELTHILQDLNFEE